jgi:hypothetical protein
VLFEQEPREIGEYTLPGAFVRVNQTWCANASCKQLVIQIEEIVNLPAHAVEDPSTLNRKWFARPRTACRPPLSSYAASSVGAGYGSSS